MQSVVYLDNAATTPIRPEVRQAITDLLGPDHFGNPSSAHHVGRTARAVIDAARRRIAAALGAAPADVIFTSGGTEADNLGLIGAALNARAAGRSVHIAVSSIEHKAVLDSAEIVRRMGGEVTTLPVDHRGAIELHALHDALESGAWLVSLMWVNNEVGVTQDIEHVARMCADAGAYLLTDAVQAVGKVPCGLSELPATWMVLSGHKIGAPKGVGALICRTQDALAPMLHGGGQQRGVRPGTENVLGIAGLGVAVELAMAEQSETASHTESLRNALEEQLLNSLPDVHIAGANGSRAPHISNACFAGADSTSLLMHLDLAGICCSSGSACNTGSPTPSHVLSAMGVPAHVAQAAVRFSFASHNTRDDVERVGAVLPDIVAKVRRLHEVTR